MHARLRPRSGRDQRPGPLEGGRGGPRRIPPSGSASVLTGSVATITRAPATRAPWIAFMPMPLMTYHALRHGRRRRCAVRTALLKPVVTPQPTRAAVAIAVVDLDDRGPGHNRVPRKNVPQQYTSDPTPAHGRETEGAVELRARDDRRTKHAEVTSCRECIGSHRPQAGMKLSTTWSPLADIGDTGPDFHDDAGPSWPLTTGSCIGVTGDQVVIGVAQAAGGEFDHHPRFLKISSSWNLDLPISPRPTALRLSSHRFQAFNRVPAGGSFDAVDGSWRSGTWPGAEMSGMGCRPGQQRAQHGAGKCGAEAEMRTPPPKWRVRVRVTAQDVEAEGVLKTASPRLPEMYQRTTCPGLDLRAVDGDVPSRCGACVAAVRTSAEPPDGGVDVAWMSSISNAFCSRNFEKV